MRFRPKSQFISEAVRDRSIVTVDRVIFDDFRVSMEAGREGSNFFPEDLQWRRQDFDRGGAHTR